MNRLIVNRKCLAKVPSPVPGERHVEERLPEAGDDPGRPGAVSAEVHPDEDHAGGDLGPVRPPALLPGDSHS